MGRRPPTILRVSAIVSLALTVGAARAVQDPRLPTVLIFEAKPAGKAANRDMNIALGNYLASNFDSIGKANPVVYGNTDPTFRAAEDAGKIRVVPTWPTVRDGVEMAKKLGAQYVLVYEFGGIKKGASDAEAALYFDGRRVWIEKSNLAVRETNGFNVDASEQSIARTWVLHIGSGPLKGVEAHPKMITPTDSPGQAPKPLEEAPAPKLEGDDQLKQKVAVLIQASDPTRAISTLRDAVDQNPFDIDRRLLLVQTLLDNGRASEAGEEADRAVELAPDREDLRSLAARAWIAAGKRDAARNDLNETIVRDPQSARTRVMLAELSIGRQEPAKALDNLDAAIKELPSRQAYYLRSICRALLGDSTGVRGDLDQAGKLKQTVAPADMLRIYVLAGQALDDGLKSMGDDTRLLMQRALVRPDDSEVKQKVASLLRSLQARLDFLSGFPVPGVYHGSNDRRALAHRLMVQTMQALQSFCSGGGQDAMIDARLDLGEALKEAAGARSAFAAEQHPPSTKIDGS